MTDTQRAGIVMACACIITLIIRTINPEVPFDGISLTLLILAGVAYMLPTIVTRATLPSSPAANRAAELANEAVRAARAAQWAVQNDGVYDGLRELSLRDGYAAIMGAASMLAIAESSAAAAHEEEAFETLMKRGVVTPSDATVISILHSAIQAIALSGSKSADHISAADLLDVITCAIDRVERLT